MIFLELRSEKIVVKAIPMSEDSTELFSDTTLASVPLFGNAEDILKRYVLQGGVYETT